MFPPRKHFHPAQRTVLQFSLAYNNGTRTKTTLSNDKTLWSGPKDHNISSLFRCHLVSARADSSAASVCCCNTTHLLHIVWPPATRQWWWKIFHCYTRNDYYYYYCCCCCGSVVADLFIDGFYHTVEESLFFRNTPVTHTRNNNNSGQVVVIIIIAFSRLFLFDSTGSIFLWITQWTDYFSTKDRVLGKNDGVIWTLLDF